MSISFTDKNFNKDLIKKNLRSHKNLTIFKMTEALSKKELILSNSFFYQLYTKYPNIEHSETSLLQSIEEITGSDRSISIKYENLLRKILFEINPIVKSSLDSNIYNSKRSNEEEVTKDILKISSPGINVEFQFNDEGLNAAINLLNSLKVSKIIN